MGEVIKSTVNKMMDTLDAARTHWLAAVNEGNPLMVALAEADAKAAMLEQIRNQQVAAVLLRFCDPELAMTEIVGQVGDSEKIRCTGLAILSGFVPGKDEYAIFSGARNSPSKVYVKEAGYRKLLAMLPQAQIGDVQVGFPRIEQLDGGIEVWAVEGRADCTVSGKRHVVEATGQFAIRLPVKRAREGNAVIDNVDGIAAKARRRLLQQLWRKATGSAFVDDANDADAVPPDGVEVIETTALPAAAPEPAKQPLPLLRLEAEFNDLVTKLDEANATMLGEWAAEFRSQPHLEALNLAWQAWNKIAATEKPDPRVHSHITSLKNELKKLLPVKTKP